MAAAKQYFAGQGFDDEELEDIAGEARVIVHQEAMYGHDWTASKKAQMGDDHATIEAYTAVAGIRGALDFMKEQNDKCQNAVGRGEVQKVSFHAQRMRDDGMRRLEKELNWLETAVGMGFPPSRMGRHADQVFASMASGVNEVIDGIVAMSPKLDKVAKELASLDIERAKFDEGLEHINAARQHIGEAYLEMARLLVK